MMTIFTISYPGASFPAVLSLHTGTASPVFSVHSPHLCSSASIHLHLITLFIKLLLFRSSLFVQSLSSHRFRFSSPVSVISSLSSPHARPALAASVLVFSSFVLSLIDLFVFALGFFLFCCLPFWTCGLCPSCVWVHFV